MRTGLRGGSFAAACVVFALVIGASPVAAGGAELPPTGDSGRYGVFGVVDTVDYAGARCVYVDTGGQQLAQIKVRPPIVYARDRSHHTDTQTVGWVFSVWIAHDLGLDTWQQVYESDVQIATATDAHNARFSTRGWKVALDTNTTTFYLVRMSMLWYPTTHIGSGNASVLLHHYADINPYSDYMLPDYCPQGQT